jgi:hypothetical protein
MLLCRVSWEGATAVPCQETSVTLNMSILVSGRT